jgi:hypothetical protein
MRSRIPAPIQAAAAVAALLVLLLIGCQAPASGTGAAATPGPSGGSALADRLEKLPTLPADVAATLDPKTNATKSAGPPPMPVRATGSILAACCSIKEQKSLKVSVALTKCAPLQDFIMAPLSDLIMAREAPGGGGGTGTPGGPAGAVVGGKNVRAYKLDTVNRATVLTTVVCMTSDGPWDATFIEDRNCNNYQPQDSLFVSGWGGLVAYYWNGGPANHPAGITVVRCNDIGTFRFPCNALSSCNCDSSPCPVGQQCPCPAPW